MLKARIKATLIHLLISAIIFIATAYILLFLYFPSVHFAINGGIQGLKIMFIIDILLGPFITLLIFNIRKQKKEIFFDVSFIACVQLIALSYGFYNVYQQRPIFLLLNPGGVIETVTHSQFAGSIEKVDLDSGFFFTELPLFAYNFEQTENEGLVRPDFLLKNIEKLQPQLEKELEEEKGGAIDRLKTLRNKYKKKAYIVRLVGSFETEWVLVDRYFNFLGSIKRSSTVI